MKETRQKKKRRNKQLTEIDGHTAALVTIEPHKHSQPEQMELPALIKYSETRFWQI